MKLWGAVAGALAGWLLGGIEVFGLVVGGVVGFGLGAWLQAAVRTEIRDAVRDAVSPLGDEMREAIPRKIAEALGERATAPSRARRAESEPVRTSLPPESLPGADAPARAAEPPRPGPAPVSGPPAAAGPAGPSIAERAFAAARDWLFGGNTIVRVGLVVLFIGLAFLARYAAAAGLFPLEARLSLVALAGVALVAVGYNRRTVRPEFGLALQGAGVAVLYLTTFAAARVFTLMPPLPAFALMVAFCALGTALALLQDARSLAFGAFLGGFAVPLLLGGEAPTPLPLFVYFTLLNLAILFIAWRRAWRELNLLGFFATFGMATLWGLTSYRPEHYLVCQVFLALSVGIYLATAILYAHNTPGPVGRTVDSTLLFGPAIAGFGLQAGLVQSSAFGSAWSALAFGAVYAAVAWQVVRQRREDLRLLGECLIAIGVGFVTLAVPLALEVKWTSAAWALEGAGAFWVGLRQARWMVRAFGLTLIAVAALILLSTLGSSVAALPFANAVFFGAILIAGPLLLVAWWLRESLPHSGSAWAKGWAGVEAVLAKPAFLAGFGFAALGALHEVTREVPAAIAGEAPRPVIAGDLRPAALAVALLVLMWLADRLGRTRQWPVSTWPGRAGLPLIALLMALQVALGTHLLVLPHVVLWLAALGLHAVLLRATDRAQPSPDERLRRWQGMVHVGGVWLLAAAIADSLQLGIDRAALWNTSWAGVTFLVACVAVLGLLTAWAGRAAARDGEGLGWPLEQHHRAYWWSAALPLAALAWIGALTTAAFSQGLTAPLPYVPLLNPVDLSVALAVAVLALWRRRVLGARSVPAGAAALLGPPAGVAMALLGFVAANAIWLRTAHHYLGIAWTGPALAASPVVQTGLAILWTLMAMALMLFAHRRALRPVWLAGAAPLGLTVAKLLLVDMSSAAGWQRIVTFIGVGVLMLVIGYFVPLPPRQRTQEDK